MSSRAIRKLRGRDDVMMNLPHPAEEEASEDEVDDEPPQIVSSNNKFLMLNISEEKSEEENEDGHEGDGHSVTPAKKTNRKKKKKKMKNIKTEVVTSTATVTNEANIDEILNGFDAFANCTTRPSSTKHVPNATVYKSVLTVEHRMLNPDNELRKIFGARALMGDAGYRRRNKNHSNQKGVWLVRPESNWERLGKTGIEMKLLENKNGCNYFKYDHSRDYIQTQFQFLAAVDSSNHHNIAEVLERCHFHVDSLLTFSDVYKMNDDLRMARELIERAIYIMERSFHTCFNLTVGTCRLEYKYPENRSLFLCLFKHMHFVSQRGCNRTSLELAKVLLSLDPEEDPLCSILLLDHFALGCGEYEFIVKFVAEWGANRNLSQLPNWAFNLALAHFYLEQEDGGCHDKSRADSDKLLQEALIMFPTVLKLLLDKCSVQADKKVTESSFFNSEADESTPEALGLLCHMFVQRCHVWWKSPKVLEWLERNVTQTLHVIDHDRARISRCRTKRKSRYQKPPLNLHRHAMICELNGTAALLPIEIRMGTMLSHDPLPPSNTVTSYTRPNRNPSRPGRNPVSLFFQSLMPGFDPNAQLDVDDDDVEEVEGRVEGNAAQLRGNVRVLMNAMRELFHGLNLPPGQDQEEEEIAFDEDGWD